MAPVFSSQCLPILFSLIILCDNFELHHTNNNILDTNRLENQDINPGDVSPGIRLPIISDNMLFLPKPLRSGDRVTIQGKLRNEPKQMTISFIGEEQQSYENVICKVDFEFTPEGYETEVITESVNKFNGNILLEGKDMINFAIIVKANNANTLRLFSSSTSFLGEVQLSTSISDAKFISYDGDVDKITSLSFEFS